MVGEQDETEEPCCSFCGTAKSKRGALVRGGDDAEGRAPVFICRDCATACVCALDDEASGSIVRDARTLPVPRGGDRSRAEDDKARDEVLRALNEKSRQERHAAGLPEHAHFHELFFNAASDSVVVRCGDRSLGHPGGRVYHRRHGAETYTPTFDLEPAESADSVVVALEAPIVIAKVTEWTKSQGTTWGGNTRKVVSRRLDAAAPEVIHEPPSTVVVDGKAAPWASVSDVLSVSDDGDTLYCKGSVGDEPGPPKPIRYGIYRWCLSTGDVSLVAALPGVFW